MLALRNFRTQDEEATNRYNDALVNQAGPVAEQARQAASAAFQDSRNALILATVQLIKAKLSLTGATAFLDFVQSEKRFMAITGGAQ
jgi:hypothetical protein